MRIARQIQQGLFPAALPAHEGFEVAGLALPAEAAGGDYYDFIPMPDDELAVVIGDISGHGLGPSLLMAETRACLRALASSTCDVCEILSRANRLLRADFGGERFVTILFARLDTRARTLEFVNAGHPDGYVLDAAGELRHVLKSKAMPLGLHPPSDFPSPERLALEPGDLVLLVTDGVLDARSPQNKEFGAVRLLEVARTCRDKSAQRIAETLCCQAREFTGQPAQEDDITAVALKVKSAENS